MANGPVEVPSRVLIWNSVDSKQTLLIALTMLLSEVQSVKDHMGWRTMLTWNSMIILAILLDVPIKELVWYFEDLYLEATVLTLRAIHDICQTNFGVFNVRMVSVHAHNDIRQVEDRPKISITRRMFPKCTLSYSERFAILGLESLECRRLKFDLKMYFKNMHHQTNLEPSKCFLSSEQWTCQN